MKVLVVGQGGREHALVRALCLSPSVKEVHACPGSEGIALDAICHAGSVDKIEEIAAVVKQNKFDLVVIGPEGPLALGLADVLRAQNATVFAPSKAAAQLEASKIFSKEFMVQAGVPTARFEIVTSVPEVAMAAKRFAPPFVLKADGLAAGKGVFICQSEDELRDAAHALFVDKVLGAAGARALLEEFQPGYELSYLVLTNGVDYIPLPMAQDHKRIFDGDKGPNTGGMGTVAPVPIDDNLNARIHNEVLVPVMRELQNQKLVYRGVLFIGLMITKDGPQVLEFNTRFGDPETQVVLPLLNGDWGLTFQAVAKGELPSLQWKQHAAACVVLAAAGYPDTPRKGDAIQGLPGVWNKESYVLHAGTKKNGDTWVASGGRVLNAMGEGPDIRTALARAYEVTQKITWDGMQYRQDIGAQQVRRS